jgi:hypothetical protein
MNPRNPLHLAFNVNAFQAPPVLGGFGNSSRTVCCGPGINNFDFSMLKDTPLAEKTTLEFRAELFNIFNHAQFSTVDGNFSDGYPQQGGTFGTVIRARDPRIVQFALKLLF